MKNGGKLKGKTRKLLKKRENKGNMEEKWMKSGQKMEEKWRKKQEKIEENKQKIIKGKWKEKKIIQGKLKKKHKIIKEKWWGKTRQH